MRKSIISPLETIHLYRLSRFPHAHLPPLPRHLPPNQTCQDLFHLCLALEFEQPSTYGAVHHLTVLCYYLQHNLYSPQGWLEGRRLLARFMLEGASPAELRRQEGPRLQSGQRSWRVTGGPPPSGGDRPSGKNTQGIKNMPSGETMPSGEDLPGFESLTWSRSIADLHLDDPQTYSAGVQQWARSVLQDTQAFVEGLGMG